MQQQVWISGRPFVRPRVADRPGAALPASPEAASLLLLQVLQDLGQRVANLQDGGADLVRGLQGHRDHRLQDVAPYLIHQEPQDVAEDEDVARGGHGVLVEEAAAVPGPAGGGGADRVGRR